MTKPDQPILTAADLLALVGAAEMPVTRRRDMISAVGRICEMIGVEPRGLRLEVPLLRGKLASIRPAAHGVTEKTFANVRSLFLAALELAGTIDGNKRGRARRDAAWAPLVEAIRDDKRVANGLACFFNWCCREGISPDSVDDSVVQRFHVWLETRTLHPRPRDLVRGVPLIWNEARRQIDIWPRRELARISFRVPSENLSWSELNPVFRAEAETYLRIRAAPDIFNTDPNAPRRPLSTRSIAHQRGHICLAASVLARHEGFGTPQALADLIRPEAFKTVLRHYHNRAEGKPSAQAILVAKTLIDIARYYEKMPETAVRELKAIAAKLPARPFDLTPKNKALLRELESDETRARLLFLPGCLIRKVDAGLEAGRLDFVTAQIAVAVDILLAAPLRMHNLARLNWTRHFKEPRGPKGVLILYIPKEETKSGRRDLCYELPEEVARNIRWYRTRILPRLGGDPRGDLFVTSGGAAKDQRTFAVQITEAIEEHVGVRMTPHQFRHLAASMYLEEHPDDFQSVTDLLGHAWGKTTLIYAGSSSRRASRVYSNVILEQRASLKLKGRVGQRRR